MEQKQTTKRWAKYLKKAVVPLVSLILATLIGWMFNQENFMGFVNDLFASPKITCCREEDKLELETSDHFSYVRIDMHPQLVIRYDARPLLYVFLKGYYEDSKVELQNGKGEIRIKNQSYVMKLEELIREYVVSEVLEDKGLKFKADEINSRLHVEISVIGGITYTNRIGDKSKNKCFILSGDQVTHYPPTDEKIRDRLYEYELQLAEDMNAMDTDTDVKLIIHDAAKSLHELLTEKQ